MKIFSQYSIIMSHTKMSENSPTQDPSRFLQKRKPKTHSVIIRALLFPCILFSSAITNTYDAFEEMHSERQVFFGCFFFIDLTALMFTRFQCRYKGIHS